MYYIYIYLDPRKAGKYKYGSYEFDFEPFYVGKGKDKRWYDHIKYNKHYNKFIYKKIKKILKEGFDINDIISKIKFINNIQEHKSFEIEKELIKEIGRFDVGNGPLLNMTNGGEGVSGKIVSEKTKKKLSKLNSGLNHPQFGTHRSKETKRKISESQSGSKSVHFGKIPWNKGMKGNMTSEHYNKLFISHSKLTVKEVHQICMLIKLGFKNKYIVNFYNVDASSISFIRNGRQWSKIRSLKWFL